MASKELRSRTKRSARVATARSSPKKSKSSKIGRRTKQQAKAENDMESTPCKMSGILSLNDDCFLEIFSYLGISDLCALKDCCQRFRSLTESVVQTRINKKEFEGRVSVSSKPRRKALNEMARMVTKLGKFITHVEIDGRSKGAWRFGSMLNHCVALKSIKFRKVLLSRVPISNLENMLVNVESLELISCWMQSSRLAEVLRTTKNLKSFVFYGNTSMTSDLLSSFTELANIETFRLRNSDVYDARPAKMAEYVQPLLSLKKLKNLEILFVRRQNLVLPAVELLSTIDSLEELTLSWFIPRAAFFKALDGFANLKLCKLFTYDNVPEEHLADVTNFEVTKTGTKTIDFPKSDYGEMPDHTLTLSRKN